MPNSESPSPIKSTRRWRLWLPILILVATGIATVWFQRFADLEAGFRVVFTTLALVAAFVALVLWFTLLTPARVAYKIGLVAVIGLSIASAAALLEFDFQGNLLPIPRWRFATPPPPVAVIEGAVDLTLAGEHDSRRFLGSDVQPSYEGIALSTNWETHPPRVLWRQPIGEGFSSFAVVGEFAVTQQQSFDKLQELVVCYHWPTGETRWQHADEAYFVSSLGGRGPRATPAIDEGRVYTLGATGRLNCLDGTNGEVIWSRDIVEETGAEIPEWGKSNSPLIVDDLVVVSAGGPEGKSLIAYDKATGEPAWSAGSDKSSYSSPQLATIAGVRQIITLNAGTVTGHDPAQEGKILWTIDWPGDMPNVAQPLLLPDDRLLISKEYSTGSALFQINNDAEDTWTTEELWANKKLMKAKFTNPVLHDGHLYGISDVLLQCIDPFKGKQAWIMRGKFGNGHVLLVDDLLLVQTEFGALELYKAQPEKPERLARFEAIKGRTWNYPVLIGNQLLMRNDREAALIELPTPLQ